LAKSGEDSAHIEFKEVTEDLRRRQPAVLDSPAVQGMGGAASRQGGWHDVGSEQRGGGGVVELVAGRAAGDSATQRAGGASCAWGVTRWGRKRVVRQEG
jgi:hypothetical protein